MWWMHIHKTVILYVHVCDFLNFQSAVLTVYKYKCDTVYGRCVGALTQLRAPEGSIYRCSINTAIYMFDTCMIIYRSYSLNVQGPGPPCPLWFLRLWCDVMLNINSWTKVNIHARGRVWIRSEGTNVSCWYMYIENHWQNCKFVFNSHISNVVMSFYIDI